MDFQQRLQVAFVQRIVVQLSCKGAALLQRGLADPLHGTGIGTSTTVNGRSNRISSGEHLIAYNMIGSYAIERAKEDKSIGIVFPADYITLMSRIAFIPAAGGIRNPRSCFSIIYFRNAARNFFWRDRLVRFGLVWARMA